MNRVELLKWPAQGETLFITHIFAKVCLVSVIGVMFWHRRTDVAPFATCC